MYDDAERRQRYRQRRRLTRSILIVLVIGISSAIGAFLLGSNLDTTHFHDLSNGFMWRFPSAFVLGVIAIGASLWLISTLIKLIRSPDEDE